MSFADQEDVLEIFEDLARHLFKEVRGVELPKLERMTWHEAMRRFGSDKPDCALAWSLSSLMDVKLKAFYESSPYSTRQNTLVVS